MNITLKNLKIAKFASEETLCFKATVYIDGKKAGEVSNDGHGAPNMYWPHDLGIKLACYAKTLAPYEYMGTMLNHSADGLIDDVLAEHEERLRLKRLCAKSTIYRVHGEEYGDGAYMQIKRKYSPEVALALRARHPQGVTIINEELTPCAS
jgi:hypothetical protein